MDTIPSTPSLTDTAPATLFAALELSRSTWLVALHAPAVEKSASTGWRAATPRVCSRLTTNKIVPKPPRRNRSQPSSSTIHRRGAIPRSAAPTDPTHHEYHGAQADVEPIFTPDYLSRADHDLPRAPLNARRASRLTGRWSWTAAGRYCPPANARFRCPTSAAAPTASRQFFSRISRSPTLSSGSRRQ